MLEATRQTQLHIPRLQTTLHTPSHLDADLLLGSWCAIKRSQNLPIVLHENYPTFSNVTEAIAKQQKVYNEVLEILSGWLKEIHSSDKPKEYWETILYRFLSLYVGDFLSRHWLLSHAVERLQPVQILTLPEANFWVPPKEQDFYRALKSSDLLNLQLFSQIANFLECKTVPTTFECAGSTSNQDTNFSWSKELYKFKRRTRQFLKVRFERQFTPSESSCSVALLSAHFPENCLRLLKANLSLGIYSPDLADPPIEPCRHQCDVRESLCCPPQAGAEVKSIVHSLRTNLPKCYVEDFSQYHMSARRRVHHVRPRFIIVGYFNSFVSAIWVAEQRHLGAKVIFVQHGGNYGESVYVPWETAEKRISDRFVSWGWGCGEAISLPAPRLSEFKIRKTRGKRLLFIQREIPLYPSDRMPLIGETDPVDLEKSFVDRLDATERNFLTVRARFTKGSERLQQISWLEGFPEVAIDSGRRGIRYAYEGAALVVVGYLFSTSFLECVAADKPVIVFGGREPGLIRPEARPYYNELKSAGVLAEDIDTLVGTVKEAFSDPHSWWDTRGRREAVQHFRETFAWTEEASVCADYWERYLKACFDSDSAVPQY